MSEFGTSATVELTVPDRELRSVRTQIEDEVGAVTVDVAPSRMPARTDGGPAGGVGAQGVQVTQLEVLKDIKDLLEKQAATGGGDGGGGGLLTGLGLGRALSGGGGRGLAAGGLFAGGTTGLAAGSVVAAGTLAGLEGRQQLQQRVPESFADDSVQGTTVPRGEAEPVLSQEDLSGLGESLQDTPLMQLLQGEDVLEEPAWLADLASVSWSEPAWLSDLQTIDWPEPAWLGDVQGLLGQSAPASGLSTGGGPGGGLQQALSMGGSGGGPAGRSGALNLDVDAPPWLEDLLTGGDVSFDLPVDMEVDGVSPSEVEDIVQQRIDEFERELERQFDSLGGFP